MKSEGIEMKTRKSALEVECRRRLRPFVEELVRATPDRRQQLALSVLATANRATMRVLTELLIEYLGDEGSQAGAVQTMLALGPPVLPALELALLTTPSERCLRRLASIAATVGPLSFGNQRSDLHIALLIAAGRAPTLECRLELGEAAFLLREDVAAEAEVGSDLPAWYGV